MNSDSANASLLGSLLLGIITWASNNIDLGLRILTAAGATVGIAFSVWYYIAGARAKNAERRLKEEELRRLKEEDEED